MKDLGKVLRLAFYVAALPLALTAVASAQHLLGGDVEIPKTMETNQVQLESGIGLYRSHILAADQAGNLMGRIVQFESNAEGLKVFFVRDGQIEQSVVTDDQGFFEATGLTAGPYSFVAAGENGFVAHGVYVTTDAAVAGEQVMSMETAAIAPSFEHVTAFINNHPMAGEAPVLAASESAFGTDKLSSGNKVVIGIDGGISGRLAAMNHNEGLSYANMAAQLIGQDNQVQDVVINQDGSFAIGNIQPGVYDFVATGDQGFVAIGFQAMDNDTPEIPAQNASYSAQESGPVQETFQLDLPLASPSDFGVITQQVQFAEEEVVVEEEEEVIVIEEPAPAPASGPVVFDDGGFVPVGGGFGGGGGGFGFGGGFDIGGLVGAAIGAFVISEIIDEIDDDDDFGGVVSPPVVLPPVVVPPVVDPAPASPS